MSSIEEKKFLCLVKLSYDISLNVTRAYTETNVLSKYDNQVSNFLKINKHDIFHLWNDTPCCQCSTTGGIHSKATLTLTFRQIKHLFEFQGNGTPGHLKKHRTNNNVIQHCLCRMSERTVSLNDFDINLLETLLKRFLNLESDVQMWLSTIREIRNCIAHATSTTVFYPGRLDKWWMKLEGSILGLVTKIPPAFYGKSIESQINVLKNSNLEAIYGKQLMEDVNAENKILLEDLAARSDTRIVECENNIRQAIIESNNDFKRQIAKVKGEFMRKFEELEAIIKGSAKQNPNVRSEHDSIRKIHVACQVEGDDIDELLTIKNLSDPDIVTANESDDKGFKLVDVKQKCILLELTASSEILSSEECLLNAIDQLINQLILAGNLNTRVQGKMTLNVTFTSPLSREELDVFSRVFCTSEIIDSDIINPTQDYSIGTVTRETQTEIVTENYSCQVNMECRHCSMIDNHNYEPKDELSIRNEESSSGYDDYDEEKCIDETEDISDSSNFLKNSDAKDLSTIFEIITEASRSVGFIKAHHCTGTGFMIGSKYFATVRHVVLDMIATNGVISPTKLRSGDCYVEFEYMSPDQKQNHINVFHFTEIFYENADLDVIILRLCKGNNTSFPPPIAVTSSEIKKDSLVYIVSHPKRRPQTLDPTLELYQLQKDDVKSSKEWAANEGISAEYDYCDIENKDKVLFLCASKMSKLIASGSLGIMVNKETNKPHGVLMLLKRHPDFLFKNFSFTDVDKKNFLIVEQGVLLSSVYDDMKSQAEYNDLVEDIKSRII